MGTYFALADQITALADKLDKSGKLDELFQKAQTKQAEAKTCDKVTQGREDTSRSGS
jgi:hypothetical protein